jgi:sensor histidine kinase regulating citrate/malate metabolism
LLKEFGFAYSDNIHEELKAIEKEQIIEAYAAAIMKENNSDYIGINEETSGELYYNETYGN